MMFAEKQTQKRNLIFSFALVAAIVPGLTILLTGIGTPPGNKLLFGGVVETLSVISLLLVWVNKDRLYRFTRTRITVLTISLTIAFLAFLIVYFLLLRYCVKEWDGDVAYYPLWLTGRVAKMVEIAGGRAAAVERYGAVDVQNAIDQMEPEYAITVTTATLLILYQMVFTTLIVALGFLGVYTQRRSFTRDDRNKYVDEQSTQNEGGETAHHAPVDNDGKSQVLMREGAITKESRVSGTVLEQPSRNRVFISYSHKDKKWLERLQVHLRPLERQEKIMLWDDTRITPGAKWREEIKKGLASSKAAILLVSADFLASDFITNEELPTLLASAASEGTLILPVIVSPCRFNETESISQFQSVNAPTQPLSKMTKDRQEAVFVEVAKAVENAFKS